MAEEERPSLHIDLDWKKQAQEEKRRLEEQEKKRAAEREAARTPVAAPAGAAMPGAGMMGMGMGMEPPDAPIPAPSTGARGRPAASATRGPRGERVLPPAGIPSLVQSLATQIALYLGELAQRDETGSFDMAKHLIDTLGVIEEKTRGNLTPEEQQFLDQALYETRMRFIGAAGQVIAGA